MQLPSHCLKGWSWTSTFLMGSLEDCSTQEHLETSYLILQIQKLAVREEERDKFKGDLRNLCRELAAG